MFRPRCKLWGCVEAAEAPCCHYCGMPLYGPDDGGVWFLKRGWLWPLQRWWRRARQWSWPRCWECQRLLLFRRRHHETFCSDECFDKWIPF